MRNTIIIGCITGSLVIILGQFGFFEALFMFLVAGVVPGTPFTVPSSFMYGLLLAAIALVLVLTIGIAMFDAFQGAFKRYTSKKKPHTKLPKRRYNQI
jgi:hypothetical protein